MKEKEKKIRGTYKIDKTKTPQENITSVLKVVMPIKLTVNKLTTGTDSNIGTNNLKMEGVQITAIGRYKYLTTTDIDDFRKIHFHMKIPGNNWGRENQRSWSVPIKDEKISLTHIGNVFDKLALLYKEGQAEEDKRIERQRVEKENLQELRTKSKMPSSCSMNLSYYPKRKNGVVVKPIEYSVEKYSISLNFRELSKKQIMKIGTLCADIDEIVKEKNF